MVNTDIKELILQNERDGKVVINTIDGLYSAPVSEFIKQPTEGILYDLNRDFITVLSFIPDPKWINDYAVAVVITALKNRIDELEKEVKVEKE